jgi:putative ABC transport system permease protein
MKTRYIKVLRDLTSDIPKNLMLVLAIAIGVFGIGAILGAYKVLTREMTANYMGTNPASATIEIDGNLSKEIVDSVRTLPWVKDAERRATVSGRMKVDDRWYPILFFVFDDFENMRVSTVGHVSGSRSPNMGSMLAERTALPVMRAKEGDNLIVRTAGGSEHSLKIVGTVHDPGLAPAWQEQAGYAYISLSTLNTIGETQGFNLLRLHLDEGDFSREHITKNAEQVADWLTKRGIRVHEIQVPPPGMHPHQSQMTAVLSIFTIFSFMILVLGSVLVATSMATLMVKQVRQVGVMKTIGGTSGQIAGMYVSMILTLCIAALILSIPLSRLAAFGFYSQIATLLNLEIKDSSIPISVLFIQVSSGIIIPILATAIPLFRGSRIPIRAALDNFGVSTSVQGRFVRSLSGANIFSDTYRLALRNAFRQRSRLALTIALLAAGGAMFMTALNVSDAWDINLKRIYTQRLYDQDIRLNNSIAPDSLVKIIMGIQGVKAVEGWGYTSTSIARRGAYEITKTYPDKGHGSFSILALPAKSTLINPTITEGRWLHKDGTNDVVLNQLARSDEMHIGDEILLSLEGTPTPWKIIGFTEDVGSAATAYVSVETFARLNNTPGKAGTLRIAYTDRSREFASVKNREIEQLLERLNINVRSSTPVWLLHNAVAGHMKVLVNSLLAMAILMALVGTLGLTSTISMNVLERTREIGIMRAIGATPKTIKNLIVSEGLTIGMLSVVIAFIFSLGLSYIMGRFIGHISFRTTLSLTVSSMAIMIWLSIIVFGSYLASIFPARKANKVTTREALTYE